MHRFCFLISFSPSVRTRLICFGRLACDVCNKAAEVNVFITDVRLSAFSILLPQFLVKPRWAAADVNRVGQVNPLGNRKRPLLLSRATPRD